MPANRHCDKPSNIAVAEADIFSQLRRHLHRIADWIRSEQHTLTHRSVRRLLEEDLGLPQTYLDKYKKDVSALVEELLSQRVNTSELPRDILVSVFRHLDHDSLFLAPQVCKAWREVVNGSEELWRDQCEKHGWKHGYAEHVLLSRAPQQSHNTRGGLPSGSGSSSRSACHLTLTAAACTTYTASSAQCSKKAAESCFRSDIPVAQPPSSKPAGRVLTRNVQPVQLQDSSLAETPLRSSDGKRRGRDSRRGGLANGRGQLEMQSCTTPGRESFGAGQQFAAVENKEGGRDGQGGNNGRENGQGEQSMTICRLQPNRNPCSQGQSSRCFTKEDPGVGAAGGLGICKSQKHTMQDPAKSRGGQHEAAACPDSAEGLGRLRGRGVGSGAASWRRLYHQQYEQSCFECFAPNTRTTLSFASLVVRLCRACAQGYAHPLPHHRLVSKTRSKWRYCLRDADLAALPSALDANPIDPGFVPMSLFRRVDVVRAACEVWGSLEGAADEHRKRISRQA